MLFACCNSPNRQGDTEYTTIAALENRIPKLIRSDLIDTSSISVIQLETTQESLIGSVTKLIMSDERIFILDASRARSLLVFDNRGRFMNSIGLIGRGPGELINILDFCVDTESESVVFVCSTGRVVKAGFNGNVINETTLASGSLSNIISYNGNYYGYTGARERGEGANNYQIVKLDRNLNIESFLLPFTHGFPGLLRNPNALYRHDDAVFFISLIENAIYELHDDHPSMRYYFDFGSRQLSLKEATSPDRIFGNDYSYLWSYSVEGDSIILMSVFDHGRPWIAILRKEDNAFFVVDSMDDGLPGLPNPITSYNGLFVSVIESKMFIEIFPSVAIYPSPDDNPLLLLYTMRAGFN